MASIGQQRQESLDKLEEDSEGNLQAKEQPEDLEVEGREVPENIPRAALEPTGPLSELMASTPQPLRDKKWEDKQASPEVEQLKELGYVEKLFLPGSLFNPLPSQTTLREDLEYGVYQENPLSPTEVITEGGGTSFGTAGIAQGAAIVGAGEANAVANAWIEQANRKIAATSYDIDPPKLPKMSPKTWKLLPWKQMGKAAAKGAVKGGPIGLVADVVATNWFVPALATGVTGRKWTGDMVDKRNDLVLVEAFRAFQDMVGVDEANKVGRGAFRALMLEEVHGVPFGESIDKDWQEGWE